MRYVPGTLVLDLVPVIPMMPTSMSAGLSSIQNGQPGQFYVMSAMSPAMSSVSKFILESTR